MKSSEHAKRSLVKTITYRLVIIVATFSITYFMTGRLDLTIGLTFMINVINTVLYYFHERLWNTIHWGKK